MTYRNFTKPSNLPNNPDDWITWATNERLLLDVSTNIPEGVCEICYGGMVKKETYEGPTLAYSPSGLTPQAPEPQWWPKCYPCQKYENNWEGNYKCLDGILPISYSLYDGLESAIWRAKNNENYRWLMDPLAAILHTFLSRHRGCIKKKWGPVDVITVVPSRNDARGGWDHMKDLIGRRNDWPGTGLWQLDLLEKVCSSNAADRRNNSPCESLFRVRSGKEDIEDKRVLLLDDTYTTGGTLRSAGLAVRKAGGRPIAVTIGRQVRNNKHGSHIVKYVQSQNPLFDPERCAIH